MRVFILCSLLFLLGLPGMASNLAACNSQILTRQGNRVSIRLNQLSHMFNRELKNANSNFSNLQLTPEGGNTLKVQGNKNGTPISISGPLQTTGNGLVELHAKQIVKNGQHEKGMMSLFGQNLADYVNLHKAPALSSKGNNLIIHPDKLLGLSGKVRSVHVRGATVQMNFASQPCQ